MDTRLKREHQATSAHAVMQGDLRNRTVERIHILHVMADPDYKKLYRNRKETLRPVWGSLDTQIYYDIIDVIRQELVESNELRQRFMEIYRPVYPKADRMIEKLEKVEMEDEFLSIINGPDEGLCHYVVFRLGEIPFFDDITLWMTPIDKDTKKKDIYFEVKKFYSQAQFDNTDESILRSPAFKTFKKKNIQKIAEIMECDENEVPQMITDLLIDGLDEDRRSICNGTPEMSARIERKLIMASHQGSGSLFLAMHDKNPAWFKTYRYQPDVNQIIDDYYIAKALKAYYASEEGDFSKLSLTRGCITDDPERDVEEILMLCNMDIIYKMYDLLMDLYYEDFSWDKHVGKKDRELLTANLKSLEKKLDSYQLQMKRMAEEQDSLRIGKIQNNDEAIRAYELENKKLREKIEELEKKTSQQKEIIDTQVDLIEALQQPIEEDDEEVDKERLQTHRFLFVGYLDTYLTELKALFPNSVFMTNVNKDISGIQVDYIVFVTKYLSHSMYYKVKSSNLYTEYPSINCNATSVGGVLKDLAREI